MSVHVRITVSPWLHRLRWPLVVALWMGGSAGERLMQWAVRKACRMGDVSP